MASPLKTQKQSVDLGSGPRVSRIRRDPPPKVKEAPARDPDVVDRRAAAIGILVFTTALLVILLAIASYNGWSPSHYIINV